MWSCVPQIKHIHNCKVFQAYKYEIRWLFKKRDCSFHSATPLIWYLICLDCRFSSCPFCVRRPSLSLTHAAPAAPAKPKTINTCFCHFTWKAEELCFCATNKFPCLAANWHLATGNRQPATGNCPWPSHIYRPLRLVSFLLFLFFFWHGYPYPRFVRSQPVSSAIYGTGICQHLSLWISWVRLHSSNLNQEVQLKC